MLKHLHISHYALIDSLEADFPGGMLTVTGETGAGKSIMLGALSLLLGARADSRHATSAEHKTVVEGHFDITGFPHLSALLADLDVDHTPGQELILRREISPTGRSRAFIDDSPVSAATLARVGRHVIDIHSQHANLLISEPAYQLDMIDAYAGHTTLLENYRKVYGAYRALRSRIAALKQAAAHARENEEFIAFRLEHLRRLNPVAGEQESLEKRQQMLSESTTISENLSEARALLSAPDTGALDNIDAALACMRRVDFSLFDSADSLMARLQSARIEVADIAATLAACLDRVETDPAELEKVENRLDLIYETQRRFNVTSEQELIAMRTSLEQEYASLSGDDDTVRQLEQELHLLAVKLKEAARELSESRSGAASEIASTLLEMARPLGMNNLRVSFTLSSGKLTASGADTPALLVAFNKNQELREVRHVASGGEISRLMLCLKALMAKRMAMPTIIFDEVDTGVSGDIAHRMARMMRTMCEAGLQVIAITHLPQVAATGMAQYKVYKEDADNATHTHIRRLSPTEREEEIASMLSGTCTTQAARLNARALLENS